jgi:tetratricopeptide (TPR) repeat protein
MKRYAHSILYVLAVCILAASYVEGSPETAANQNFYDRQYHDALATYKGLVDAKYEAKDRSYVIYLLNYAIISQYTGDFSEGQKAFMTAHKVTRGKISGTAKAFEWLKAGSKRVYKLKKREEMLLHFYMGTDFAFVGNMEKAIIEYKKVHLLEEGKPRLPLVCFYMGKVYEIEEKYDDALIEYRALLELTKTDPYSPAYFELARIHSLRGEQDEAAKYLKKLSAIADAPQLSIFEEGKIPEGYNELIVQIDRNELNHPYEIKIYADNTYVGQARLLDVFRPGVTLGEIARKTAKETSSGIARNQSKKALTAGLSRMIPGVGGLVGDAVGETVLGDEEDRRSWYYAPAGFSLFAGYIPDDTREVTVEFVEQIFHSRGCCVIPRTPKIVIESDKYTYDVDSKPCVRIKDQIFLTVRYQSEPYGALPQQ